MRKRVLFSFLLLSIPCFGRLDFQTPQGGGLAGVVRAATSGEAIASPNYS
ncbi:MAG: hypothetical protein ACI87A_000116 [Planctomycetota bacterium]|jgi:hypothetical protein